MARASKDLARPLVRNLAVFDHGAYVHEHVAYADRVAIGLIEGRDVANGLGGRTP